MGLAEPSAGYQSSLCAPTLTEEEELGSLTQVSTGPAWVESTEFVVLPISECLLGEELQNLLV